ncbi:MAG: hypothetical protein JSU94_01065 [Phycisphaerales bacterium]|nr:MAG: hypothetical protein JSU94_01065 [Phycisphaerales bacterium]
MAVCIGALATNNSGLDPCGKIHIPIGIANSLDTLKTFVEAEGNFSPGVGSYGVYFWVFDIRNGKLFAPTMDAVKCEHGLYDGRYLIPWFKWTAGAVEVRSEVCEVKRNSPDGEIYVVGSCVTLCNTADQERDILFYTALRPLGPAGFDVKELSVCEGGDVLLVEGHAAIVAARKSSGSGVLATDTIGGYALRGEIPQEKQAVSASGDCSGALRYELTLSAGGSEKLEFVCPVLPGRRAVGHEWDGVSKWAQFDLAELNPSSGGLLQPDPGLEYYRGLDVSELFIQAEEYWRQLTEKVKLDLPDKRWEEAFAAIIGHAAMSMNQGAPDVAVVNYNVFNRDGVYVANIFQKSGNFDLAAEAIDYFIEHPFNGRSYPEADNPGQILWAMGQQLEFTFDAEWAARIYPAARKIAEMIEYYRTTEGPHWVAMDSLEFGENLPENKRRELKPGRCDGFHPEYTQAFDIAGLRQLLLLSGFSASSETEHKWGILSELSALSATETKWAVLALDLLRGYGRSFEDDLGERYGGYCVLWPCRLYPSDGDKARQHFAGKGAQKPSGWRYFPLARAHQGLLAGNRQAGYGTLQLHLEHEQMKGWYAFDEGGKSGSGGWNRLRTTWNGDVAMPHGWAIAEFWLLLRDCLVFQDGLQEPVLLSGIPPEWFTHPHGITIRNMPVYGGRLDLARKPRPGGATLELTMSEVAANFSSQLRLPPSLNARVTVTGQAIQPEAPGEFVLPPRTSKAEVDFNR